jgi:hypothetical protein
VLAAVLVVQFTSMWTDPVTSRASRFQYSLLTAAAVGFVAWLAQWNLFGYRF